MKAETIDTTSKFSFISSFIASLEIEPCLEPLCFIVFLSLPVDRSEHGMATYWRLHSLLSPIGVGFNSFVLYLFVIERKNLIKSVNVMMW